MWNKSLLHLYSLNYGHCLKYFRAAALLPKETNNFHVERLKLISAGVIADLALPIISCSGKPPIPSFPGEFLEGRMSDGTYIRLEQLSRDTKKLNCKVKITDPNNLYEVSCTFQTFAETNGLLDPNCIIAGRRGDYTIRLLQDNVEYKYIYPDVMFHGYMKQTKVAQYFNYKGSKSGVIDKTNNLICEFKMEEPVRSWTGILGSFLSNGNSNKTVDKSCLIYLSVKDSDGNEVAKGWANYCALVVWEGMVYWRAEDKNEDWDYKGEGINEGSNSSVNREYLMLMEERKFMELDRYLEQFDRKTS